MHLYQQQQRGKHLRRILCCSADNNLHYHPDEQHNVFHPQWHYVQSHCSACNYSNEGACIITSLLTRQFFLMPLTANGMSARYACLHSVNMICTCAYIDNLCCTMQIYHASVHHENCKADVLRNGGRRCCICCNHDYALCLIGVRFCCLLLQKWVQACCDIYVFHAGSIHQLHQPLQQHGPARASPELHLHPLSQEAMQLSPLCLAVTSMNTLIPIPMNTHMSMSTAQSQIEMVRCADNASNALSNLLAD